MKKSLLIAAIFISISGLFMTTQLQAGVGGVLFNAIKGIATSAIGDLISGGASAYGEQLVEESKKLPTGKTILVSNVCNTLIGSCFTPGLAPSGYQCVCQHPNGLFYYGSYK